MLIIIVLFLSENDSNFVNLPIITKSLTDGTIKRGHESSLV